MVRSTHPETVSTLELCSSVSAFVVSVRTRHYSPTVASASELLRFKSRPRLLSETSTPAGVHAVSDRGPLQWVLFRVFPPHKAPDDSSPPASPMPLVYDRSPSFPGCHDRWPRLRGLVPCEGALHRFALPRWGSLPSSGLFPPRNSHFLLIRVASNIRSWRWHPWSSRAITLGTSPSASSRRIARRPRLRRHHPARGLEPSDHQSERRGSCAQ